MFYNLMTLFWCVLVGATLGVATTALAGGPTREGVAVGAIACVAGVVMVFCWREFKRPG